MASPLPPANCPFGLVAKARPELPWCFLKNSGCVMLLPLTPKEHDLLLFLVRNRGKVYGREQLLDNVWGYDYDSDTRTVDAHIRNLREKIEEDPANPVFLLTVRGVGYKVKE